MAQYILPLLADLSKHVTPVAGRATARICLKTAELARAHPTATVCLTAGRRPKDSVWGAEVMAGFLNQTGIPENRILRAPSTECFRTLGEMRAFSRILKERMTSHDEVFIVARWWHLPRATALLKKELGEHLRHISIFSEETPSLEIHWMARELAAWANALWHKELTLLRVA